MRAALPLFALCCALAAPGGARAEWFADAGTAFFHDDNVSRAQRGSDIRSDHALVVHASGGYYMQLTDRTGATLAATVRREQFSHYPGLSHVGVGPPCGGRSRQQFGVGLVENPLRRVLQARARREQASEHLLGRQQRPDLVAEAANGGTVEKSPELGHAVSLR